MARDLKDAWSWLDRLIRKVDRLEAGGMLENSSITNGRLRFVGGLLRLDSGARLEVVGTASIEGPLAIKGTLTVTGTASIEGPLTIKGTTVVEGDLSVTKTLDVTATTKLQGVVTLLKDLILQAPGKIKAGTIEINPTDNGGVIKIGTARIWVNGTQFEIQAGSWQIWTDGTGICIGSRLGTYARFTGSAVQLFGIGTVLDPASPKGTLRKLDDGSIVSTRIA